MLEPGAGKTKRAYVWAYARGVFGEVPGVIYEFCAGRGARYPIAFLQHGPPEAPGAHRARQGTLVRDEYKAYDSVPVLPSTFSGSQPTPKTASSGVKCRVGAGLGAKKGRLNFLARPSAATKALGRAPGC